MSKWNVDALEALKGKLKLNVKMFQLVDMLHTAAGGFMDSAEVESVRAKTGDVQQIEQVIDILQGKGTRSLPHSVRCCRRAIIRCGLMNWNWKLRSSRQVMVLSTSFLPFCCCVQL